VLAEIEDFIDRQPISEDQKSALWLWLWAWSECPRAHPAPTSPTDRVPVGA
jgi:hypothetical protein